MLTITTILLYNPSSSFWPMVTNTFLRLQEFVYNYFLSHLKNIYNIYITGLLYPTYKYTFKTIIIIIYQLSKFH